jgi:hypothetical protein
MIAVRHGRTQSDKRWADSRSKCNKSNIALIGNKSNAVNEMMLCDMPTWSMEKLESKGRFPLCHRPDCCGGGQGFS